MKIHVSLLFLHKNEEFFQENGRRNDQNIVKNLYIYRKNCKILIIVYDNLWLESLK